MHACQRGRSASATALQCTTPQHQFKYFLAKGSRIAASSCALNALAWGCAHASPSKRMHFMSKTCSTLLIIPRACSRCPLCCCFLKVALTCCESYHAGSAVPKARFASFSKSASRVTRSSTPRSVTACFCSNPSILHCSQLPRCGNQAHRQVLEERLKGHAQQHAPHGHLTRRSHALPHQQVCLLRPLWGAIACRAGLQYLHTPAWLRPSSPTLSRLLQCRYADARLAERC